MKIRISLENNVFSYLLTLTLTPTLYFLSNEMKLGMVDY